MKLSVYKLASFKPKDENEYYEFCDILDTSSLKTGFAEFVSHFSHHITKKELYRHQYTYYRVYDRNICSWRNGVILLNSNERLFVEVKFN